MLAIYYMSKAALKQTKRMRKVLTFHAYTCVPAAFLLATEVWW